MLAKSIRKLFKLIPPEPKEILKIITPVQVIRYHAVINCDNGENHTVSKESTIKTETIILNTGYGRKYPLYFLGYLDQYGLTTAEYNELYWIETRATHLQHPKKIEVDTESFVDIETSGITNLLINPDKINHISITKSFPREEETYRHEVK